MYLLAPMRLLTPILEEEETLSSQIGGETGEGGFNRSVMTVISELLTNHSKSMQIYQSLSETRQGREYSTYVLINCNTLSQCKFVILFLGPSHKCPIGRMVEGSVRTDVFLTALKVPAQLLFQPLKKSGTTSQYQTSTT